MSALSGRGAPDWTVRLPDRRTSYSGMPARGTLVLWPDDSQEERIDLPLRVARILLAKQRADELHPQSRAELLYVVGELSRRCAASRIEDLINRREYSEHEMTNKLRLDGYAPKTIDACLQRATASGLVSDARYADSYIRSKLSAGWGMRRIERELSQRGIEIESVDGWPYEYLDPDDEADRAAEVARRKHVSGERAYEKLVRHLCGRGFSMGASTRAARIVLDERSEHDA